MLYCYTRLLNLCWIIVIPNSCVKLSKAHIYCLGAVRFRCQRGRPTISPPRLGARLLHRRLRQGVPRLENWSTYCGSVDVSINPLLLTHVLTVHPAGHFHQLDFPGWFLLTCPSAHHFPLTFLSTRFCFCPLHFISKTTFAVFPVFAVFTGENYEW